MRLFARIDEIVCDAYRKRVGLIKKLIGEKIIDALLYRPLYTIEKVYRPSVSKADIGKIVVTRFVPLLIEKQNSKMTKITGISGNVPLEIVYFNARSSYFKYYIKLGVEITVCGKLTSNTYTNNTILQIIHPEYIGSIYKEKELIGLHNVYPLTNGVTLYGVVSTIRNAITAGLSDPMDEWIPQNILQSHKWESFKESVLRIHFPKELDDTTLKNKYLQRLCFDECLAEHIAKRIDNNSKFKNGYVISNHKKIFNELLENLHFNLTDEQNRVIQEIENDMASGDCMTRLLQGDVGSGKTIVSLLSALLVIENGYQVALLAPTEILARQHYETFRDLLNKTNLHVNILTSSEKGKVRTAILQSIANGTTNIVVGTHSIISESVVFNKLGMVIVDEQHKFGVRQRLQLVEKSNDKIPHVLSMTATPIPRTLILLVYGDISVSTIRSKPHGRREIITSAVPMGRILEVINAIKKRIANNEKIYWVCALIEESDNLDYTCVLNRFDFLREHFGDDVVMMHGKMKADERNAVFEHFRSSRAHILVSTTIIEVGVDIRDASIIIIENAEKFGLSQLHQLRGRVGRSNIQSYCILLYDNKIGHLQRERIKVIRENSDGFYIAEKDLALRGGGEILGTKQSGTKKYRMFDMDDMESRETISNIMEEASELAKKIDLKNTSVLLQIFLPEDFEYLKQSF